MEYIDRFVAAVPNHNKQAYIEHATKAAAFFKKHGATQLVECWGDDVPDGKLTSFPMAVKCKPDGTVVFSWVVWPSKDVRDQGMAKLMQDGDMDAAMNPMPFDGARLIFGGFQMIVRE